MYFICYVWHTHRGEWVFMNKTLTDEHPLQWLSRIRKEDPNPKYQLVSWQKLSTEEVPLGEPFVNEP